MKHTWTLLLCTNHHCKTFFLVYQLKKDSYQGTINEPCSIKNPFCFSLPFLHSTVNCDGYLPTAKLKMRHHCYNKYVAYACKRTKPHLQKSKKNHEWCGLTELVKLRIFKNDKMLILIKNIFFAKRTEIITTPHKLHSKSFKQWCIIHLHTDFYHIPFIISYRSRGFYSHFILSCKCCKKHKSVDIAVWVVIFNFKFF